MDSRTILIGDVHGCIDELKLLLNKLNYCPEDRVILLGDLIDRGPDSLAVIRLANEYHFECVMGNHEHQLLKFLNKGDKNKPPKKKNYYSKLSIEDIDFIKNMKQYIKIDNTIAVHAGLKPGIALTDQLESDLFYLRYTNLQNNFSRLKSTKKYNKEKMGFYFWTHFWNGPESVVYGHNVHSLDTPNIEKISSDVFCYGLDTGCCYGGKLTALILETKQVVQVQSKKTYYKK
jgi:hypothetical protein